MNLKTAYEEIITGKLDALPVPDMADAIWKRIEAQLDLDMPTDEGPGTPPAPKPRGWVPGKGFIVFVAAVITSFLIYFNQQKSKKNPLPVSIQDSGNIRPLPASPVIQEPDRSTEVKNNSSPIRSSDNTTKEAGPIPAPLPAAIDSSRIIDSAGSVQLPKLNNSVIPTQVQKDSIPVKKGRGVQGISEGDYRIVPKRDSS